MTETVLIIGGGPAGLTAALYAARANLQPLVLEGPQVGGQLTTTTEVENYPGFPEGQTGPELVELMHRQAERFGARFSRVLVESADVSKRPFCIQTDEGSLQTRTMIIASGASAMYLGLESEQKLRNHGVTACATCDGFFYRGKEVVVIGGGDTAMEEALFLTRMCTKVTVIHRRDKLRASKIMAERAMKNDKIEFAWDSVVEEVLDVSEGKVSGVRLRNVKTDAISELPCEGFFLAIGHTPNVGFLNGALKTDKAGYIVAESGTTATSVEGVFACGDVMDPRYKQAVTAAGTGCMAAIDAEKYLEEHPES